MCGLCVTSFSVTLPLIQSFDDVAIFDRLLVVVRRFLMFNFLISMSMFLVLLYTA